jgi:hypothetical protein
MLCTVFHTRFPETQSHSSEAEMGHIEIYNYFFLNTQIFDFAQSLSVLEI